MGFTASVTTCTKVAFTQSLSRKHVALCSVLTDSTAHAAVAPLGGLSEEDTKILLEKEFDDYYEDRAHKSAGALRSGVKFKSRTD